MLWTPISTFQWPFSLSITLFSLNFNQNVPISRLTLVLSCAMNFKNYPHDEQLCNLKIESSKFLMEFVRMDNFFTGVSLLKLISHKI